MTTDPRHRFWLRPHSRREFLCLGAGLGVVARAPVAAAQALLDLTPRQTLGPCFAPGSPETLDLRPPFDAAGVVAIQIAPTDLRILGRVVNRSACPIAHARIEFWHTDVNGDYSDIGTAIASRPNGGICLSTRASFVQGIFRGHLFTDANGSFALDTYVPGLYRLRTRHIHFSVHDPDDDSELLRSQLYFPPPFDIDADFDDQPDLPNATTLLNDSVLTGGACPVATAEECVDYYRDLILSIDNDPAQDGFFETSCRIVVDRELPPNRCPEPSAGLLGGAALLGLGVLARRRARFPEEVE